MENLSQPYLVVDSEHMPLSRAVLESPPDARDWTIKVLDNNVETVSEYEVVELVGMVPGTPARVCRIIGRRNDRLVLEQVCPLDLDLRQHLRIPVKFDSFIYPLTGKWQGRYPVTGYDMSCGGVAFFCDAPLENGEQFEIVIPVTVQPVIVKSEIIRPRPSAARRQLYAAKFIDMIPDEEAMVQEAVFSIQIRSRKTCPYD